jgi:polysaccharide pyruvyl transferase WcaK-like protein
VNKTCSGTSRRCCQSKEAMRVIVATGLNEGEAEYKNMGDFAMLQAAVGHLLALWPDATIEVLTDSPVDLARYCPGAKPLPRAGCACWVDSRILPGRYQHLLPKWASSRLGALKRVISLRWPFLLEYVIHRKLSLLSGNNQSIDFNLFMEALDKAGLLVVCGSGGFADSCQKWNLFVLGTMEAAIRRGIKVVMFGQGMGPLSDPIVLSRAKEVLPEVALITLRGGRGGVELLESMGVSSSRVSTTGDEAVELAYEGRTKEPGIAVGVNLRVAPYADVNISVVGQVRSVLQEFARRQQVPLIPIPIASHDYANDHQAIRHLLAGFDDESDGGVSLTSPQMLIEQAARCRVVVTGAYHAAVFALAQGIPVVCLSNSSYYLVKFQGLEDLFGVGCAIVTLSEPYLQQRLMTAIEEMWNAADSVRSPLLQSALRQIEARTGAYQLINNLPGFETAQTHPVLSEA